MKAFETSGTLDDQRRLVLDESLPVAGKTRVKVIVLVPDSAVIVAESKPDAPAAAEIGQNPSQPLPKGLTPWRAAKLGIKLPPPPPRAPIIQRPEVPTQEEPQSGYRGAIPDVFPEPSKIAQAQFGAELVVRKGSQSGKVFGLPIDLDAKQGISIGSAVASKIPVPHDGVLRYHAKITCEVGRYMLRDLALTSRTTVNGNMLDGPTELRNGDVIGLGASVELAFRQPASGFSRAGTG